MNDYTTELKQMKMKQEDEAEGNGGCFHPIPNWEVIMLQQ